MRNNQVLLALRELLVPESAGQGGEVVEASAGVFKVATRAGIRSYSAVPGVVPSVGDRVVIRNGVISQVVGAKQTVQTYYV